jgi:hypothetical protein
MDTNNVYANVGRGDLQWPPGVYPAGVGDKFGYYAYPGQSAQQQEQQDEWAVRGSNVFR